METKNNKNTLKVGHWYKLNGKRFSSAYGTMIFCYSGKIGNNSQFGFDFMGEYQREYCIGLSESDFEYCIKATDKEIIEMLVNWSKKK